MAPPSPPGSPSDDCLLRSSPHGSNTASEHSYLADQDTPTSPTPNTNTHSRTSYTPYKQSKRNTMPSPGNFEVIGFSRIGSHNHQSTSVSQASTLVSQESRCETLRTGAPFEGASTESWERPQVVQESQRIEDFDPMEDLPVKDWEGLEMRYERDMEAAIQHEQSLIDEIEWVMKMMKESTIASSRTESDRAKKRLRTRIAYVQQSEEALGERRSHYKGVVDAFQNAMSLLGGL